MDGGGNGGAPLNLGSPVSAPPTPPRPVIGGSPSHPTRGIWPIGSLWKGLWVQLGVREEGQLEILRDL